MIKDDFTVYIGRPLAFAGRYVRKRWIAHSAILVAVFAAVTCSVATQYGVKFLVDALAGANASQMAWQAFAVLVALIAADNLLWRVASWIGSTTFVRVTGDLRRDLFRHLTGHSPAYFTARSPGTLTSRITATSNALFTVENMVACNALPPCIATVVAIAFLATVSVSMALSLTAIAAVIVVIMFVMAERGTPLHHEFADKAAAVDGEMVDVIGNISLVRSYGGLRRENRRFAGTVDKEVAARRRSLLYLERLRVFHAVSTVVLTIALLAWAIMLWQNGAATPGDVVLVATLGLAVLSATRDLAVALVDVTQHVARLSEALSTLLIPHQMADDPTAPPLEKHGASLAFNGVSFKYPEGNRIFGNLSLAIESGQKVGFVGPSGGGKSTIFAILQRFYDVDGGEVLIDGQDIRRVTQHSLQDAMAVVPQDISLFNRTLRENIRYGQPGASDADVLAAAIAARCTDIIDELPEGLNTVVGNRGVRLSGGQRQRIAIARAILKDAPLVLLDEATSALDGDSIEHIKVGLDNLIAGRTVLAIAHRLASLRDFDRIIVLERGKIVEDGAPAELLARDGPYRRLSSREYGEPLALPQAA